MTWKTFFNPFEKFDEKQLLIVGLVFFVINAVACYFTKIQMDSIYHFSFNENISLVQAFIFTGISYLFSIIVFFILGKIFNRRTRIIDITNTVLISQVPTLLLIITTNLSYIERLGENAKKISQHPEKLNLAIVDLLLLSIFALFVLGVIVYSFTLFYNGFKTATNMKKWQHIVIFVIVFLFSILVCQLFLPLIKF